MLTDPLFLSLKVAVASTLAVVSLRALGSPDVLSAGFVALVCISPSAHGGLRSGLQQMAGSLLGATAGGLPLLLVPSAHGAAWALLPGLAAALLASFRLGLGGTHVVTGFTVLYFHSLSFGSPLATLTARVVAVLVGVGCATLVNVVVSSVAGPRIAARRLALARRAVAASLRATAAPSASASPVADAAFAAVAELRLDLSSAARERLFPGAPRARATALAGLAAADALEETAHLVKETLLLLPAADPGPVRSALAPLLDRAATALEADRPGGRQADRSGGRQAGRSGGVQAGHSAGRSGGLPGGGAADLAGSKDAERALAVLEQRGEVVVASVARRLLGAVDRALG